MFNKKMVDKMKKVLVAGILFLAATLTVFAQDGKGRNREHGERDQSKRYERLAEKLDLNAQQVEELKKIDKAHADQMQAYREKMKEERQKTLADREKMRNDRDEAVKKLLTDEQKQKYEELKSQKQKFHKDKGKPGKRHHRKG